jgi:catechol 2,3-dioxygenase-like lactoylglutathione lyase family enzyme
MIWYRVRDLDAARAFYAGTLGFTVDELTEDWVRLSRGKTVIGLAVGEPDAGDQVAMIDVDDIKGETDRLRREGVEVGIVLELRDAMRIADVFDPDGNRIQLGEEISP